MRDYLLTGLVGLLLLSVFKHPAIGPYLWAWLSLMNQHKLTYGFAFRMPFAQAAALVTLLVLFTTKAKRAPPIDKVVVLQLTMVGWMMVTSFFAMAPVDEVVDRVISILKIHLMLIVTWMLVRKPGQIRVLVWVVALSVGFFGIKGGVWTVMTGGGGRVWGPPGGMLEGNNELAVGLVIITPLLYFLRQTEKNKAVRLGLTASIVSISFSILGSQSRGALLALVAMAFFLGLKGKHPVRTSLVLLCLMALAVSFMPDSWTSRMETINAYQADGSAMSRIWTWTTLFNAAVDRPLVGAGFRADNLVVFARYAPTDPQYEVFQGLVFVAHSIYFQMLGEHGFVGLFLFLTLGCATWIQASGVARQAAKHEDFATWLPLLMRMAQVSLIGYAVGGAFLSLAYLDLPYYVMGFVVLGRALLHEQVATPNVSRPVNRSTVEQARGLGST